MVETIPAQFQVLDDRFRSCDGDYVVERLHRGARKTEGPAYFPAGRYLVWSDIPNDRLMRWDETTGTVGVFRQPSGYANGNSVDRQGRLVTCEQGNRRVTRTEHDGTVSVLTDRYRGKRLNSPNDVVVRADGTVWFTDPSYGIDSDYEGNRGENEFSPNPSPTSPSADPDATTCSSPPAPASTACASPSTAPTTRSPPGTPDPYVDTGALMYRVVPMLGSQWHSAHAELPTSDMRRIHAAAPGSAEPAELARALYATARTYGWALDRWAARTGRERPHHALAAFTLARLQQPAT